MKKNIHAVLPTILTIPPSRNHTSPSLHSSPSSKLTSVWKIHHQETSCFPGCAYYQLVFPFIRLIYIYIYSTRNKKQAIFPNKISSLLDTIRAFMPLRTTQKRQDAPRSELHLPFKSSDCKAHESHTGEAISSRPTSPPAAPFALRVGCENRCRGRRGRWATRVPNRTQAPPETTFLSRSDDVENMMEVQNFNMINNIHVYMCIYICI